MIALPHRRSIKTPQTAFATPVTRAKAAAAPSAHVELTRLRVVLLPVPCVQQANFQPKLERKSIPPANRVHRCRGVYQEVPPKASAIVHLVPLRMVECALRVPQESTRKARALRSVQTVSKESTFLQMAGILQVEVDVC